MSERGFDHAVLGAGCAGLSLAVALAEGDLARGGLLVVEPRETYRRDRTWCYWDVAPQPFEDAVAHRWSSWKVRHRGREILHSSDRYRYCEIPADAYYRATLERLARHPDVELRLGERALGIEEGRDEVRVTTDRAAYRARRAFDGRPPREDRDPHGLLQHFVGLRVRTETAAFDPGVVTLMDFDVSQSRGIHFFYVLPHDEREALVEATYVSPSVLPEECYLEAIDRYLAERLGVSSYKTEDRESGVIPMSARRRSTRASSRVYRIGTAGGLVRPSTGYAFLAIQRWTRAMAERLASRELPDPPEPRGGLVRRLDAIFLSFLRNHPERGPEVFSRLFERLPPDVLVRFLTDSASQRDRLAAVRAMPFAPFCREAWRSRARWLRC